MNEHAYPKSDQKYDKRNVKVKCEYSIFREVQIKFNEEYVISNTDFVLQNT